MFSYNSFTFSTDLWTFSFALRHGIEWIHSKYILLCNLICWKLNWFSAQQSRVSLWNTKVLSWLENLSPLQSHSLNVLNQTLSVIFLCFVIANARILDLILPLTLIGWLLTISSTLLSLTSQSSNPGTWALLLSDTLNFQQLGEEWRRCFCIC